MLPRQTPNEAGPQLFPACRDSEHHKNSQHTGHPVSAEISLWEEQGLKIKQSLYKCKTKSYRYTLKQKATSQNTPIGKSNPASRNLTPVGASVECHKTQNLHPPLICTLLSAKPSMIFTEQWFQDRLHTWGQNVCRAEEMKLSTLSLEQQQLLWVVYSFVKFRGTSKKRHIRFSAGYRKMGFTCSAILSFYSAGLIADFMCHGCLRHSRQGRVISQKDNFETRQPQLWQYHGHTSAGSLSESSFFPTFIKLFVNSTSFSLSLQITEKMEGHTRSKWEV